MPTIVAFLMTAAWACATELEERFQSHINYLAGDELGGRGVGSDGIEKAAQYIAGQFKQIGLEPAGDDGTYFQTFEMTLHRKLTDQSRLAFSGDETKLVQGKEFIPFNFSSDQAFSGPVSFCGYGIVAEEKSRDDFAKIDVTGEVAILLRGEPPSWADERGDPTRHAMFRNKVYNAKDHGAAAVLIVNQTPAPGESDELTEFEEQGSDEYGVPAFHVTRALVDAQLKRGGLPSLDELQGKLDAGECVSASLAHIRAEGLAGFEKRSAPTHNVIGIRRGEGPLADQAVVIGAHYDHLGIRKPMMRTFKEGKLVREVAEPQIHNGADDNASGVSGLIEIARMFADGPAPKRSVLFVAFTGEETGLHGSKHYIENAVVPPDKTVAMLNMDMIGRMPADKNEVTVFGVKTGKEFMDLLSSSAAEVDLTIAPSDDAGGRSDQAPFYRKNIPSLHFFTGHHGDYHKPSDDADKINAAAGAKVASLVYKAARRIVDRSEHLTFQVVKTAKPEGETTGTPMYRVVMGLAPGYADDGKPGMAVEAVNAEGPADLAGMKAGDRIIRIGDKDVKNIYDYMAATRNNNPGDTVEVTVLREGQELKLKVTLSAAG